MYPGAMGQPEVQQRCSITLRLAVLAYLQACEEWWSPRTRAVHGSLAAKHILPRLGRATVDLVTPEDVRGWLASKLSAGYAVGTVATMLALLRGAFDFAVDVGEISANPCAGVVVGQLPRPLGAVLSRAQVELIGRACSTPAQRLLVSLVVETGLRPREVAALAWDSVDWRGSRLSVAGTSPRELPVSSQLLRLLLEFRRAARRPAVAVFGGVSIHREVAAIGAACGLEFTLSALRDCYLAQLVGSGTPFSEVARLAGLRDAEQLRARFGHLAPRV